MQTRASVTVSDRRLRLVSAGLLSMVVSGYGLSAEQGPPPVSVMIAGITGQRAHVECGRCWYAYEDKGCEGCFAFHENLLFVVYIHSIHLHDTTFLVDCQAALNLFSSLLVRG